MFCSNCGKEITENQNFCTYCGKKLIKGEMKNNNITIADCESAAIAYICKANNVECIIIKGISDFPSNEEKSDAKQSNDEQLDVFITNTPIVMKKICTDYLCKFI